MNLSVVVSPAVLVRSSVLVSLSFIPYSTARVQGLGFRVQGLGFRVVLTTHEAWYSEMKRRLLGPIGFGA